MNILDQCRDADKLNLLCKTLLELAIKDIKSQGVNPLVVETYRTPERQRYLYCQGRTVPECIEMGIEINFAKGNCKPYANKVTWTLNSIHCLKNAVDVIPVRQGVAIWNTQDKDTLRIISTMQRYGFEAGANWNSSPDSPHFQIKNVSNIATTYTRTNNNVYITRMLQKALNEKNRETLIEDGAWGNKTEIALNNYKSMQGWQRDGKLGVGTMKKLL